MGVEPQRRRIVGSAARGTSGEVRAEQGIALDDRPLQLRLTRDQKRLLVVLPYEVWIHDAMTLALQRSIELASPRPSVAEGPEGVLWIGGSQLVRSNVIDGGARKIPTKLTGFVEHVAVLRPDCLCGVGAQGELLFDPVQDVIEHQRRSSEHDACGLVASADERAVFIDGTSTAWIIDPMHASGYTQLRMSQSTPGHRYEEGLSAIGLTTRGRLIVAARDGAVAWTTSGLRLAAERFPVRGPSERQPLSVCGDDTFVYVLRPKGLLERWRIEPYRAPPPRPQVGNRRPEPEPDPPPDAEETRLERAAEVIALLPGSRLGCAGSHADGTLGRLWAVDLEALRWTPLRPGRREVLEGSVEQGRGPNFVATRSKIKGRTIRDLTVDQVLAASPAFHVTTGTGAVLDRPCVPEADILPADTLVLPAMIRFREGTARPALLMWPGIVDGDPPETFFVTWGDEPRGWFSLDTPNLRVQRWRRSELFPMQVALPRSAPTAPGRRIPLPTRWVDPELFAALAAECKHQLKVLW